MMPGHVQVIVTDLTTAKVVGTVSVPDPGIKVPEMYAHDMSPLCTAFQSLANIAAASDHSRQYPSVHYVVLQGCNFFAAKVVANRGLTDNFSYDGRFVAAGSVTAGSVPLWLVLQCPHQQTYLARYSYSVKAKMVG